MHNSKMTLRKIEQNALLFATNVRQLSLYDEDSQEYHVRYFSLQNYYSNDLIYLFSIHIDKLFQLKLEYYKNICTVFSTPCIRKGEFLKKRCGNWLVRLLYW